MENEHTTLLDRYPDFISLDELRRVLKVSPKSARYLVEHGIIPAIDTGRITWRYKIATQDVITYLCRRENEGSMIPPGAVSSRQKGRNNSAFGNRKSFSQYVADGEEALVAEYFSFIYADYDEVLTTIDIVEMTGLEKSTVLKLLKAGKIQSIESKPKYLVPKQYLLEFVATRHFIEARTQSEHFIKLLGGFEIWKVAKSSR
jgi:hypothetical protein